MYSTFTVPSSHFPTVYTGSDRLSWKRKARGGSGQRARHRGRLASQTTVVETAASRSSSPLITLADVGEGRSIPATSSTSSATVEAESMRLLHSSKRDNSSSLILTAASAVAVGSSRRRTSSSSSRARWSCKKSATKLVASSSKGGPKPVT